MCSVHKNYYSSKATLSHPGGGKIWVEFGLTKIMVGGRKGEHSSNGEPHNLKVNLLGLGAVRRLPGL